MQGILNKRETKHVNIKIDIARLAHLNETTSGGDIEKEANKPLRTKFIK